MFRELLGDRFALLRARNVRYSLRAFARDLGIHHATLSQLLSGRRPASVRQIRAIGARLGLDDECVARCCAHELDATVRSIAARPELRHDSRWIAERTGISVDAVNASLHRLLASGALRMVDRNDWQST
ncbi:MAG TPA: helix-turn-helix transcriptional regulator [Nannocystaceae bacterium]|nr:helix-turn-helix transcriptional regulator [Nannocystaceae bacterium]